MARAYRQFQSGGNFPLILWHFSYRVCVSSSSWLVKKKVLLTSWENPRFKKSLPNPTTVNTLYEHSYSCHPASLLPWKQQPGQAGTFSCSSLHLEFLGFFLNPKYPTPNTHTHLLSCNNRGRWAGFLIKSEWKQGGREWVMMILSCGLFIQSYSPTQLPLVQKQR